MNLQDIQGALCSALCESFVARRLDDGSFAVDTAFYFPDGDGYSLYLQPTPVGFRISDRGHTLMQLSYYMDVTALRSGNRKTLFERSLAARGADEEEGELVIDAPKAELASAVVRFSQLVTEVRALEFLNRARVENTFFQDLEEAIAEFVPWSNVVPGYVVPGVPDGENYPVDYYIPGKSAPLYLFGVHSRDKARLTTIILQHLVANDHQFDSLLVFRNQGEIPSTDLARLSNVGGEQVASLDARRDLHRKIAKRAA